MQKGVIVRGGVLFEPCSGRLILLQTRCVSAINPALRNNRGLCNVLTRRRGVEKKYEGTVSRYAIRQYSFDGSGICGLKISFQLYFSWVRISRGSFAWSSIGGLGCSSSCKLCSFISSCKASPASSFGRASSCISSTLGFSWYGCSDNSGAVVGLARRKDFRFFLRKVITAATAKSKVTMAPPAALPAMTPSLRLVT